MEPENKDASKEFGKVIDALHNKQKLPSLRTYQGDMAQFIRDKDQSVISIAVKEREKKEEKEKKIEEKEKKLAPKSPKPKSKSNFGANLTTVLTSIVLLAGGAVVALYALDFFGNKPVEEVVIKQKIIPYNSSVTLANITPATLGAELANTSGQSGINAATLSDVNGNTLDDVKEFLNFLKVSPPTSLLRTMKGGYAVGTIAQDGVSAIFLAVAVDDFGSAFSAMLEWETQMSEDLSFLIASGDEGGSYAWKDIIIKNKDTRALVNLKNEARIAYTFLDKNTILIANKLSAIGTMSAAYASRSFAR